MGRAVASRIRATFEVVTPVFLGGADPSRIAELRARSTGAASMGENRRRAEGGHEPGELIRPADGGF